MYRRLRVPIDAPCRVGAGGSLGGDEITCVGVCAPPRPSTLENPQAGQLRVRHTLARSTSALAGSGLRRLSGWEMPASMTTGPRWALTSRAVQTAVFRVRTQAFTGSCAPVLPYTAPPYEGRVRCMAAFYGLGWLYMAQAWQRNMAIRCAHFVYSVAVGTTNPRSMDIA